VFPRKIKRLATVFRLEGLVSMNFQQIVEQFHVELVILNDQDFLLVHSSPCQRYRTRPAPPKRQDVIDLIA
jgi:hypothetical protein